MNRDYQSKATDFTKIINHIHFIVVGSLSADTYKVLAEQPRGTFNNRYI